MTTLHDVAKGMRNYIMSSNVERFTEILIQRCAKLFIAGQISLHYD